MTAVNGFSQDARDLIPPPDSGDNHVIRFLSPTEAMRLMRWLDRDRVKLFVRLCVPMVIENPGTDGLDRSEAAGSHANITLKQALLLLQEKEGENDRRARNQQPAGKVEIARTQFCCFIGG